MFRIDREPMSPLRRLYIDDPRLRNKSPRTIETYVLRVVQCSKHFGKSPAQLGPEELRTYQQHLLMRRVSWSMFNQTVCALRIFYNVTLGRPDVIKHIPFAKRLRAKRARRSPAARCNEDGVRDKRTRPSRRRRGRAPRAMLQQMRQPSADRAGVPAGVQHARHVVRRQSETAKPALAAPEAAAKSVRAEGKTGVPRRAKPRR